MRSICWLLLLSISALLAVQSNAELYASINDLKQLVTFESVVMKELELYIDTQKEHLSFLRRQLAYHKREYNEAKKNPEMYVSHPLNAFLLAARLTAGLTTVKRRSQQVVDLYTKKTENLTKLYNLKEDRREIVKAIRSIQRVYHIPTRDVTNGIIFNNTHLLRDPFSPEECSDVGKVLAKMNECEQATHWFGEAVYKEENANCGGAVIRNPDEAMNHAKKQMAAAKDPYKLVREIEDRVKSKRDLLSLDMGDKIPKYKSKIHEDLVNYLKECNRTLEEGIVAAQNNESYFEKYSQLCRKVDIRTYSEYPESKCFYASSSQYLKMFRYGVEVVKSDPEIYLFYDIITKKEITELKNKAIYQFLKNAKKAIATNKNHIAKLAWLKSKKKNMAARISQRIERLTGLSDDASENLQVVNYGIGGRFSPHVDYLKLNKNDVKGNRMATFMTYLSNVKAGGNTVFLNLNVTIEPKQGTGVFWYNLNRSLKPNKNTIHAACPVIIGNKWIANKWFRANGQIFKRPCGLEKNE